MITLITKTQLELNLEKIEAPLKRIEARAKAVAGDLNMALNSFWTLPEDQLVEVLNHYGPAKVNEIFTAHARNAEAINALLADRGIEPIAKIGAAREFTINEAGLFELVPLPEPEIVEEPVIDIVE